MRSTESAETYIVQRYRLWRKQDSVNYDYKHRKGARIAEIIQQGGTPGGAVLELGVGPAGIAVELSRRGIRVVGIDLAPDALDRARAHARGEDVRLLRASGFSLPFKDGSFPVVYASQVLHLFESGLRVALMREVFRVLQPGGRFVFDMKNRWSHPLRYLRSSSERRSRNFPSQGEMLRMLEAEGFRSVTRAPGVFPLITLRLPNVGLTRRLAHTTFFVARKPSV